MTFSTTGLVNTHVITSWRSLLQASQHSQHYRPSQHASHHGVLYYRPSQHTCDHIMAFSTTGLVNMHVITSWRSLLQA